jgi:hypothetical protein
MVPYLTALTDNLLSCTSVDACTVYVEAENHTFAAF